MEPLKVCPLIRKWRHKNARVGLLISYDYVRRGTSAAIFSVKIYVKMWENIFPVQENVQWVGNNSATLRTKLSCPAVKNSTGFCCLCHFLCMNVR